MGFNAYNSGYCKCHRSYTGEKVEYKAKHGKENQMQELVSLGIPIKEIYIFIFLIKLNIYYIKNYKNFLEGFIIYFLSQLFLKNPVQISI